jgi:hypothetical protein
MQDCFVGSLNRRRLTIGKPMEYGADKEAISFQSFTHAGACVITE